MRRTLALLLTLVGLLGGTGHAAGKLRIVTTVPDLAAIAGEIAGARAEVASLLLPTQDPHFADARPHLALQLNRADLLLVVGLDLEVAWLPVLLTGSRNPRIQRGARGYFDASTFALLKDVPRARVDRSMGDVHAGGNPHYLVDPRNAVRIAVALASRLGELDPKGFAAYRSGALAFTGAVLAAEQRWKRLMAAHRRAPVVAYHRSWAYFTDAIGLKIIAHVEPKPGIPPSAAHVLRVIRAMKAAGARLLLQEEYYPDRTSQLIAQKAGARLVVLSGGTDLRRKQRYTQRIDDMVRKVVGALKKK